MEINGILETMMYAIPAIIAAILAGCLFIPKFTLSRMKTTTEKLNKYLANKLRFALYQVKEKPEKLFIRIGRLTGVELFISKKNGSTEIKYQANATPLGWNIIILVFIFGIAPLYFINIIIGFLAIGIILYMFYKEKQFVDNIVKPLLPPDSIIPEEESSSDEIKTNLITGLSEGHRLATTAYEAELASYHNRVVIYTLALLPIGFLLFVVASYTQYGLTQQFINMFPWMILCAIIFDIIIAMIIVLYIRRQTHANLIEYSQWSERIQKRLKAEITKTSDEEDSVSTFEFLTKISEEIPKWINTIKQKEIHLDVPGQIKFVYFRIEWAGVYFLIFVVPIIMTWNIIIGSIVGAIGLPMSIYYLYTDYQKWKKQLEQETTQTFNTWNKNYKDLKVKMEQYLQGL